MGALPPNPRDLAPGADPEGRQKTGGVKTRPPFGVQPLERRSGRFPPWPCPPSRSSQDSKINKSTQTHSLTAKEPIQIVRSARRVGLPGHLPCFLCVRKERRVQ